MARLQTKLSSDLASLFKQNKVESSEDNTNSNQQPSQLTTKIFELKPARAQTLNDEKFKKQQDDHVDSLNIIAEEKSNEIIDTSLPKAKGIEKAKSSAY